ncbi:MAG: hypothetical protein FJ134_14105 [Deltaproteobacteria bacterium]|nr:hypothetical protein [Deltaproteobacteria bacterium]
MRTVIFDTLEFAKTLKAANFTDTQAEALAQAVAGIVDEQLTTKRDLKELEAGLKRDLKELEAGLKRDLKELEVGLKRDLKELEVGFKRDLQETELRLRHDLTLRFGAMLVAGISIVAALVKLL